MSSGKDIAGSVFLRLVCGTWCLFFLSFQVGFAARSLAEKNQTSSPDHILHQAEADLQSGHPDIALEEIRSVLEKDPDSADAYLLMGEIQSRRGDARARASLLHSLELNPSLLKAHVLLGRLDLQSGSLDAAEMEFRSVIQQGDDASRNGSYGLGLTLLERGNFAAALPQLTEANRTRGNDSSRTYALISDELQLGERDLSVHLRQFDSVVPPSAEITYRLGVLLLQHGLMEEARGELQRVVELITSIRNLSSSHVDLHGLYLNLAKISFTQREYRETLQWLSRVRTVLNSALDGAEMLMLSGQALIGVGQTRSGFEELKKAVAQAPSNPTANIALAWAALLVNNPQAAADALAKLESEPAPNAQVAQMRALVSREFLQPRRQVPFTQDWHIKGSGLVCCPCKTPCPCRHNALPTNPHCEATGAYHIEEGHYGGVTLNGLKFVTVDANMQSSRGPFIVFVDPSAREEELIALERLFQAFDPLKPVVLPAVLRVPISFKQSPDLRTFEVEVDRRVHLKVVRQFAGQHAPVRVAALDPFANVIEYAQNVSYKVWGKNRDLWWDFSGRQANFRLFDLRASNYTNQMMLVQFQDSSGSFNRRQQEIINKLALPLTSTPVALIQ